MVMRNRITNQIMPSAIPLAELESETELSPKRTLPRHHPLWRYMDIEKFIDLITTRELYLARLDGFVGDDFEGLWSQGNRDPYPAASLRASSAFRM